MRKVIDISKFNTVTDWDKVKNNVYAVVIRLGFRGYGSGTIAMDAKYKSHLSGAQSRGIPYSIYFFPCSINDKEAEEEADYIIDAVKGLTLSLPVFLDSEVADGVNKAGRSDNLSVANRTRFLKIICEKLEANGIPAGVYASTSWLNNQLNMSELSKYTIWVAQYNTKCTYGGTYALWQYTSKGSIPGISGNVDVSEVVGDLPTTVAPVSATPKKSNEEIAAEVLDAKWGKNEERKQRLTAAGYDYNAIQAIVNATLRGSSTFKVRVDIANLCIRTSPGVFADNKTGRYTGKGTFEIDRVQNGVGSVKGWGHMANGAGWFSLDYATRL